MISRVHAKNFKGRDFEVALTSKSIIVGPNGSGKSAVLLALQIALEGQVQGAVHKTNQAIMDAFGSNSPMYVEARVNGRGEAKVLGRQFARDAKGSVTQTLMIDRQKADQKAFARASVDSPRVVAIDDFLAMSSRAMIAHFAKNLSGEQIEGLAESIEQARAKLLKSQNQLRENEVFISRTAKSIADLNLPPGSAAQVADELERTNHELKEAEAELSAAIAAEEKCRKDEERKQRQAAAQQRVLEASGGAAGQTPVNPGAPQQGPASSPEAIAAEQSLMSQAAARKNRPVNGSPSDSIKKILETITAVNCPGCKTGAAFQVAKLELRKWEAR
jgi:DNA repair exonuclease SbcCD ATPase subunit